MSIGTVTRALETFVERVGFRHRFANERSFGEDFLLPRIGLERLALLNAERPEHGHEETVAVSQGLRVEDCGEVLPICQPPRRRLTPYFASGRKEFILRRIIALAVRIDAHRSHECLRLSRVGFQHPVAKANVDSRRMEDGITLRLRNALSGRRSLLRSARSN